MLSFLHIENIAVIEKIDVEFKNGFNVLSGETGAGKSIIIDAINMVIGLRTSRDIIRKDKEKAYVCATFSDISNEVLQKLNELNITLDDDQNLILEREITQGGKGASKINGRPVSSTTLKDVSKYLINIHGQRDNGALLQKENHQALLDSFGANYAILNEYKSIFDEWSNIKKNIKKLKEGQEEKAIRLDILEFQINEIESANIYIGEYDELVKLRKTLLNSEKIFNGVSEGIALLYEGGDEIISASDAIASVREIVNSLMRYDDDLSECSSLLESITYEIEECVSILKDSKDRIDYIDYNLNDIENRIVLIENLKRKYGRDEEAILTFLEGAIEEKDALENKEFLITKLEAQETKAYEKVMDASQKLTAFRKKAGEELANRITIQLKSLNMDNAKFTVMIEKHTDCEGNPIYRPSGCDNIEFMIKTNNGEDEKPLIKIASGGELSRIMLAIKSVMTKDELADTLIFDEIDSGISGRAASKVADALYNISKQKQILCVTHLVSIAAKADTQFLISKDNGVHTRTTLLELTGEDRVEEIARLIGGEQITEKTLANARELLEK